jgi:tRNA(Arg) A34 adenosine deaminase TadA
MRKSTQYYFDLAIKIADGKDNRRAYKIASVAIRNDGVIVGAPNSPTPEPSRTAHAEWRVAQKIDMFATVFVARVLRKDGSLAMSRPCPDCQKILYTKRVKKVLYTIDELHYGCWCPETDIDTYYRI